MFPLRNMQISYPMTKTIIKHRKWWRNSVCCALLPITNALYYTTYPFTYFPSATRFVNNIYTNIFHR